MATEDSWGLLVRRDALGDAEVQPVPLPDLAPGEVRLAVEKFTLTMNNVTYARLGGGELPFWDAFPAPDGYGRPPVWAFLRVVDSRNPDVRPGGRYYGYVPLGTHHTVGARRTARGFVDTSVRREFLPVWYRTFQSAAEPDALDDLRTVYRQVFPASFLLGDFVTALAAGGAKSALITSASSLTAIGLADRIALLSDLPTVGVTSPGNVGFVTGLGRYTTVTSYDELDSVLAPTVLVDFTGSHRRISAIYQRFPGGIDSTALVGYTHPDSVQDVPELTDPAPEIFFTPVVEELTVAEEGEDRFHARYQEAEQRFLDWTATWLRVDRQAGPTAITDVFRGLLAGTRPPGVSPVLSP
jgi:Protein of unknown function (DUF2855)